MDGDEYFGTLGGSLMKDLLADLQVDDNDWSLEQLEKELASLDQQEVPIPSFQQSSLPSFNAASLVVSHAQERSSASLFPMSSPSASMAPPGMGGVDVGGDGTDAWSLSLQKFTALSLQEDFLAADSARRQSQQQQTLPPPGLAALEGAEDYDIGEKPAIAPPPGLVGAVTQQLQINEPHVPNPKRFPKTPQNSINVGANTQDATVTRDAILAALQPMQEHDDVPSQMPVTNLSSQIEAADTVPPTVKETPQEPPVSMQPPQPQGTFVPPPQGAVMPPIAGQFIPHPQGMVPMAVPMGMGMPPPPQGPGMMSPPPAGVVVGAAVPSGGPAWQTPRFIPPTPHPPPPPPRSKIFCDPYPAAPPIPATALETAYMSGRDIAYVVHAILKPVLAEVVSEDDYYVQYLKRRIGVPGANPVTPKKPRDMNSEMASRETKSKEWASDKATLGMVAKSNVARPRALIATPSPVPSDQDTEQQKQRANLWKARVYCDQAYQAYQKVIDIWRAAPPGSGVPPQVQLHLARLMKCMGIVLDNETKVYTVDGEALKLLAKLGKGRTLIARVLEQALLPPNAVQALLPELLNVIIPLSGVSKQQQQQQPAVEDMTVNRLFRAVTSVMLKLNTSGDTMVKCLQVVQTHGKASISNPPRMECVHALLQKGSMVVSQDPSPEIKTAWGNAESQFMALLQ